MGTPVMPISGWMGDNLLKKSDNMTWWKGMDVVIGKETVHVDTLQDVFNDFLPTHTASNPCTGKVFTVEMHHQRVDFANPGDNVGLNIKGLDKNNMPRSGDVMVY